MFKYSSNRTKNHKTPQHKNAVVMQQTYCEFSHFKNELIFIIAILGISNSSFQGKDNLINIEAVLYIIVVSSIVFVMLECKAQCSFVEH